MSRVQNLIHIVGKGGDQNKEGREHNDFLVEFRESLVLVKDWIKSIHQEKRHHDFEDKSKGDKHGRSRLEKAHDKQHHKRGIHIPYHSYRKQRVFFTHVMYRDIRIDECVPPFRPLYLRGPLPVSSPLAFESLHSNKL